MTKACEQRFPTLVAALDYQANQHPEHCAFTFLERQAERVVTFAGLRTAARGIARGILRRIAPGERVLLLCPAGLSYIELFFGCMYAGVIAVPLYPPRLKERSDRVGGVLASSGARLAVTMPDNVVTLRRYFDTRADHGAVDTRTVASLLEPNSTGSLPQIDVDTLAFIQYTSGSTGAPKGVTVSQGNITANLTALSEVTGCSAADRFVNWLPPFHDLGLINTIMLPVLLGAHSFLMSPMTFVQRPVTWLEALSRHRGTIAGAPNFAYDLCVEKAAYEDLQGEDLSNWRIAFNAAEPISAGTMNRFASAFAAAGFRKRAFYPAYGMAEATAFVTGGEPNTEVRLSRGHGQLCGEDQAEEPAVDRSLVSCGRIAPRHELLIVDPSSRMRLPDGVVGEIWVSGPSISQGYWGMPQLSSDVFNVQLADGSGRYLRTGDLGFVRDHDLFVSGRLKDVIIVRGQNCFPQDVERLCSESHDALVRNGAAAFGVHDGTSERLVVIQEVKPGLTGSLDIPHVVARVRAAVAREFQLSAEVVLVRRGSLERTSSGKLRRSAIKKKYLTNELQVLTVKASAAQSVDQVEEASALQGVVLQLWRASLRTSQVDVDSNFFEQGGDSLDAIRLLARIDSHFGVSLPIEYFYDHASVRGIALWLDKHLAQTDQERRRQPIVRVNGDAHPLSHAQQRLWFMHQLSEQRELLNLSTALEIRGELCIERLQCALARVLERHEALRTVYALEGGGVVQRVRPAGYMVIDVDDLRGRDDKLDRAGEIANQHCAAPFDLLGGPIFRVRLLRLAPDHYYLLIAIHHIAADAWSVRVFYDELSTFYADDGAQRTAPEIRYTDFSRWQRASCSGPDLAESRTYWRKQLAPPLGFLILPYDHPRPARQSFTGARYSLPMPFDLGEQARMFAQRQRTTLFVTLLSAFQLQLRRLSGSHDIVIGTDVAGRNHPQLDAVIGFFVNQLVLRVDLSEQRTFADLVKCSKAVVRDGIAHQQVPFEQLIDELAVERGASHTPLFQVKFLFAEVLEAPRLGRGEVRQLELQTRQAQYDLTLSIEDDRHGSMTASFYYQTALFTAPTIADFAADYLMLLRSVLEAPEEPLNRIPCSLTQRESYQRLLRGEIREREASIKSQLEQRAQLSPQRTAVVCGDRAISYLELNGEANRLAHYLLGCGVSGRDIVGIHIEHSINQVVAVLALIKLGIAFLPLDPDQPTERVEYMLSDSRIDVVITSELEHGHFAGFSGGVIPLDHSRGLIAAESQLDLPERDSSADRAYVLYTSGSAGRPKGAQVTTDGLLNLCTWYRQFAEVSVESSVLHAIPLSFDASIKNILVPLMSGAKLVVPDCRRFDPSIYNAAIAAHGVSVINCVPSVFYSMLSNAEANGYLDFQSLRLVALGGESADLARLRPWLESAGCHASLANVYGPTECTDISTSFKGDRTSLRGVDVMPIGKPIDNVSIYVSDAQLSLAPPGVTGEILIGGAGVGPGYLGQAGAGVESQRFVPDVFAGKGRLYRTGDLGKWDSRGQLIYQGRMDEQIKVHGVRIEIAEVEAALLLIPEVVQVKVLLVDNVLRAFMVVSGLVPPTTVQLRERLGRRLPQTWVPRIFTLLEAMPLLANGKIDVRSLRTIPAPAGLEGRQIDTPRDEVEQFLVDAWRDVLSIDKVGINENVFQLGADSMIAVKLVAMAQTAGLSLSVADVFELQTVSALAHGRILQPTQEERLRSPDAEHVAFDMLSSEDRSLLQELLDQ